MIFLLNLFWVCAGDRAPIHELHYLLSSSEAILIVGSKSEGTFIAVGRHLITFYLGEEAPVGLFIFIVKNFVVAVKRHGGQSPKSKRKSFGGDF